MDAYRDKRGRWQQAMLRYLDQFYPGLASGVVASSFNTALSVRQYLNAPDGAVYGFAPTALGRQPAPFAAHRGIRTLSGVRLCRFRRLYRRGAIRRRLRRHDFAGALKPRLLDASSSREPRSSERRTRHPEVRAASLKICVCDLAA
jgi:hypothetical protein